MYSMPGSLARAENARSDKPLFVSRRANVPKPVLATFVTWPKFESDF